jgi:CspA family cold shock protein
MDTNLEGSVMTGVVKRIVSERGFGFIHPDSGGKDVFFHVTSLTGNLGIDDIETGDKVEFNLESGDKGPVAVDISLMR